MNNYILDHLHIITVIIIIYFICNHKSEEKYNTMSYNYTLIKIIWYYIYIKNIFLNRKVNVYIT